MENFNVLLSRNEFKNKVFIRDKFKCIICKKEAIDAHHILDRKLFSEGGYYIDNGVSLCFEHHLKAENGIITPEILRIKANINNIVLPDGYSKYIEYDKWGTKMYYKHPRIYHFSWSSGLQNDDRKHPNVGIFKGQNVVATLKLDGENTNMYRDKIHARSMDSKDHPSRTWVKQLHGKIKHEIPNGWRICGENLFAKHSIHYKNLESYFYVFSIWNENKCLSWNETLEWCDLLNLKPVSVLYEGKWNIDEIKNCWKGKIDNNEQEGYVLRIANGFVHNFNDKDFGRFLQFYGKYVRRGHIQTDQNWMYQAITPNLLKE